MGEVWHSAVTAVAGDGVRVRGYDVAELMGRVSVGQAVHLILRGELPSENIGRVIEAVLVSCIDAGAVSAGALAARRGASAGTGVCEAVGSGIASAGEGRVEACARHLHGVIKLAEREGSMEQAAVEHLRGVQDRGERMAGFGGGRAGDARAGRVFRVAKECGVWGTFIEAAHAVEQAFADMGERRAIDLDGAIAAVLSEIGFEPSAMEGIVIVARAPGLVAHVLEERHRERPMREISPMDHAYDGPAARRL